MSRDYTIHCERVNALINVYYLTSDDNHTFSTGQGES